MDELIPLTKQKTDQLCGVRVYRSRPNSRSKWGSTDKKSLGHESGYRTSHSDAHYEIQPPVLFFPYLPGECSHDHADKRQHQMSANHLAFFLTARFVAPGAHNQNAVLIG
jgi:hypothetical protein